MENRELEAKSLLLFFEDEHATNVFRFVGHQINVVDNMGSSVVSLAGILLALTTAFLPEITALPFAAKISALMGSVFVLFSAALAVIGVFRLVWISKFVQTSDKKEAISDAINVRNRKTAFLNLAISCLIVGLIGYVISLFLYIVY